MLDAMRAATKVPSELLNWLGFAHLRGLQNKTLGVSFRTGPPPISRSPTASGTSPALRCLPQWTWVQAPNPEVPSD
jgi:hypothetical protein